MRYVHSTLLSQAYWKPIEIYCWNSLHQGWSVPRCWYMKLLLPLLKVKYYTRWHKLTILSIHTFNKFNSPPISRKSWGWHRIPWTIFMPLFISIPKREPLNGWEDKFAIKHSVHFLIRTTHSKNLNNKNHCDWKDMSIWNFTTQLCFQVWNVCGLHCRIKICWIMVASYVRPPPPFILQSESQQTQISRNHLAHIMRNFTHLHSFDMNMWNVTYTQGQKPEICRKADADIYSIHSAQGKFNDDFLGKG